MIRLQIDHAFALKSCRKYIIRLTIQFVYAMIYCRNDKSCLEVMDSIMKCCRFVITVFLFLLLSGCSSSASDFQADYLSKLDALSVGVKASEGFQSMEDRDGAFTVFLSVSDGKYRCKVYSGHGDNFDDALHDAGQMGLRNLGEHAVKYLKLDILSDKNYISAGDLSDILISTKLNTYRKSIAFDAGFSDYLLESELNSAGILDYTSGGFDLDYLNSYFSACGRNRLAQLPESYIEFTTLGYFCDEDNQVHELGHDVDVPGYGRRRDFDFNLVLENAGEYLRRQVLDDGRFVYGYTGYDNHEIEDYNILRHAGTAWSLMNYYRLTGDESIMADIDSVMDYLLSQVIYHDDMAFIYDVENDEIKLGSSGLGLIALVNYIEISGRQDLLGLSRQLADGILYCLNDDGTFNHVYDIDLNLIEKTRTVYYDGEATYGLCRLYDLTGDAGYLDAVSGIIKRNFIENEYETIGDHWVAYTLNSFLKSRWDSEIFDFALRNVSFNLTTWESFRVPASARFEACANLYDLYKYAGAHGHVIPEWFDFDMLARFERDVDDMLNLTLDGFFWQEIAMYQGYPDRISYGFFDRTDAFRTRIDDTQHSYNGILVYLGLPVFGQA